MNQIIITGRLTKDPELKTTTTGKSVSSFCVAVDRYAGKKTTDFLDVVAWGSTAEFVNKYFKKGQMIGVVGFLSTRTYEDREGKNRKVWEIVANSVEFVGSKAKEEKEDDFTPVEDDEDLPF